jgi:4-hydroxybenzoate polyprenyltransferase
VSGLTVIAGAVRLIHPAPTVAVVALSAALAAILTGRSADAIDAVRIALVALTVLGSQIATGALNDWADRERDRIAQPAKPIPAGDLTPRTALLVASMGLGLQVVTSASLGALPLVIGLAAVGSAVAYNLWLSRTPFSIAPYLVSFGLLPLWVAAGVGVPLDRVAVAAVVAGPFAGAAHLANTVRDFDVDAAVGSRSLAQVLGRRRAFWLAWTMALAVGIVVGAALAVSGRLSGPVLVLGVIGLASVAQGIRGPGQLWAGILVAAVTWTAAWGLATG